MRAEAVIGLLARGRWFVVLALAALAVGGGVMAGGVGVDNSLETWFLEGDPTVEAYRQFQRDFGNDEVAVIALHHPEGVFRTPFLERLVALTAAIEAVDGVHRASSLAAVDDIQSDAFTLQVGPLMPEVPADPAACEALQARVMGDPLLAGRLISRDAKTALIVAQMADATDMDVRRDAVLAQVAEVIDGELAGSGIRARTAGLGVVYDALNRISTRDSTLFMSLCYVLVIGVLILLFRRLGPVIVALAVVLVTMLVVMGLYGAAGLDVNMITMVLPTIVVIVGVADSIHVLFHVAEERGTRFDPARVRRALGFILLPCLFTSLTTAVGFASLVTARTEVIRQLGLFAAGGVLVAFAVTFAVAAAALTSERFAPRPRDAGEGPLPRALAAICRLSVAHRGPVLGLAGVLVLLSAYGVSQVRVDTFSIGFLKASHPVRVDSDTIEEEFGYYVPMEFTVEASGPDGVRDPELLARVDAWQRSMEDDTRVSWTAGLPDVVKRLNQVLRDGRPEDFAVPESGAALEQALLLYESDPDNDMVHLTDAAGRRVRVTAGVKMTTAREFLELMDDLTASGEAILGSHGAIQRTGYLPLYCQIIDYIVQSQISSFSLAFAVIFALMVLVFRSLRLGALSVLPNTFPIFLTLGLMGIARIHLDLATVTIAAVVIGIVVDDTIHFLYRYRVELAASGGDHERAAERTCATAGAAMTATTLILAAGFGVLCLASVKSVIYFGLLTSTAMLAGLLGDLVIMPALLTAIRPRL